MKNLRAFVSTIAVLASASFLSAATITVTTTNIGGAGSFLQALTTAQSGDTINFNIPGAGPHIIATPDAGYPIITANRLTIDGYSQPGSSPNTHTILSNNNAVIKIVLDSRDGPGQRTLLGPLGNPGYGDSESAILAVRNATNFVLKGVSMLARHTPGNGTDPDIYCVALIDASMNAHLQGNWFGLHPDGTNIFASRSSVASFAGVGGTTSSGLVFGTDGNGVNDRAEFNISMGMGLAVHLETPDVRVAGNFINVFPDGTNFLDLLVYTTPAVVEAIENGRGHNMIIGTDGNGVGDAEERNIIGETSYNTLVEFWRPATNVVIAGNYINLGVDGKSMWTNYFSTLINIRKQSSIRIGSDFDGVSDDLEGNYIYNLVQRFIGFNGNNNDGGGIDAVKIVARGNHFYNVNSDILMQDQNVTIATYYSTVLLDSVNAFATTLDANIAGSLLYVTIPPPNSIYPTSIVDIYSIDPLAATTGYINSSNLLTSVIDGGAGDLDPRTNFVALRVDRLHLTNDTQVAALVTFSRDSGLRTEAGRAVTAVISEPITISSNGPAVQVPGNPPNSGPPGPYPNYSVSSANWFATNGPNYNGFTMLDLNGNGPIPWAATKINRADFAVRLAPADPQAARHNLQLVADWDNSTADQASGQSWRPSREAGVVIPTARQNGPIDMNDTTGAFYPTIGAGYTSSGNGYSMVNGTFGAGDLDVETGKAGGPGAPFAEANFNFATTWFPYDQGWTAGVIGAPTASAGNFDGPFSHSPGLEPSIMTWNDLGGGTFGGEGVLALPGVNSLTDGLLFTTSADGASDVNIVSVAPLSDGAGWAVTIREDSDTDPNVLAVAAQSEFQFVYIPYTAQNLIGGRVNAGGTLANSAGGLSVTRTGVGTYAITIPGKTGTAGSLLLQNAGMQAGSTNRANNNFLSYEYNTNNGTFVVKSQHTVAGNTAAAEDTDFYVAWVDFTTPLAPAGGAVVVPPIMLGPVQRSGNSLVLTWTGGAFPFQVQRRTNIITGSWVNEGSALTTNRATVPITGSEGYFRVLGPGQ